MVWACPRQWSLRTLIAPGGSLQQALKLRRKLALIQDPLHSPQKLGSAARLDLPITTMAVRSVSGHGCSQEVLCSSFGRALTSSQVELPIVRP
jgi:hypothetical protein